MQRKFVGTRLGRSEFEMLRGLADRNFDGNLAKCLRKLLNEPLTNPVSQNDGSYYPVEPVPQARQEAQEEAQ